MTFGGGSTPVYRPVMVFIDGEYLRIGSKEMLSDFRVDHVKLSDFLVSLTSKGALVGELIRVFYYDAIASPEDDATKYASQDLIFGQIRQLDHYEVRLGRLIKTEKGGYRQKGVDVLLAIDMITKAYEKQYEIAVLVGGDDDLVDIVKAVKNTGKRVHGVFFEKSASKRLVDSFDVKHPLTHEELTRFVSRQNMAPFQYNKNDLPSGLRLKGKNPSNTMVIRPFVYLSIPDIAVGGDWEAMTALDPTWGNIRFPDSAIMLKCVKDDAVVEIQEAYVTDHAKTFSFYRGAQVIIMSNNVIFFVGGLKATKRTSLPEIEQPLYGRTYRTIIKLGFLQSYITLVQPSLAQTMVSH